MLSRADLGDRFREVYEREYRSFYIIDLSKIKPPLRSRIRWWFRRVLARLRLLAD